jgi:DNA repair exonuclease SbcCD ATPase subunit
MLEGEYLEMVNQLKTEFDKKDKELQDLKEKHIEVFKNLISVYGYVRIMDDAAHEDIGGLMEILRSYLSEILAGYFENINISPPIL